MAKIGPNDRPRSICRSTASAGRGHTVRQPISRARHLLDTFLHSRYAPGLTHTLLLVLLAVEFGLILTVPLWPWSSPGP